MFCGGWRFFVSILVFEQEMEAASYAEVIFKSNKIVKVAKCSNRKAQIEAL